MLDHFQFTNIFLMVWIPYWGSNTLKLVTQIACMLVPGDVWSSAEDSFRESEEFYLFYCNCNQYVVPMITYDVVVLQDNCVVL